MSVSPRLEDHESEWLAHTNGSPAERARKKRRTASYHDAGNQETGLMRDGESPGIPRFVGSGSGIYFVRTVYDILARSTGQPSRGQSQLVPGEDDQLDDARESVLGHANSPGTSARAPFWRDDEITANHENISFEALIAWTRSYFAIWHPAFPFLHGPEVLETFERVAKDGIESLSGPDAAIIRAMMSVSLADARQLHRDIPSPVPSDLVFLSLDHVASSVLFVLGTPASLKNIQAALCVQLFLVSMLKFNMASRLGGLVVRMAYHLGLHRCPRRYPNFSPHDVSMRKRIWWSFYCLERMVCQALGLPLDVQDDDVDVCFPSSELHRSPVENSTSHEDDTEGTSQLHVLTLLSKHAQLRGMILELRHKSLHVRRDTTDRALSVQSKLSGWANEVHEFALADETDDEGDAHDRNTARENTTIAPLFAALMSVLEHESTIALNRPLLAKKPATSASQAALQACIHASRAIIETLDDRQLLGRQLYKDDPAPTQGLLTWPLMTWSVWMSCFILAFAALEGVTSASSAQRYAKRSLRILKQLSKRGTAWPSTCARAVEQLMTALDHRDTTAPNDFGSDTQHSIPVPASDFRKSTRSPDSVHPHLPAAANDGRYQNGISSSIAQHDAFSPANSSARFQAVSANSHVSRLTPHVGRLAATPQPLNTATDSELMSTEMVANPALMPHNPDFSVDMDDQDWLFDPLGALDFSNFAQAGSAESSMGFSFY